MEFYRSCPFCSCEGPAQRSKHISYCATYICIGWGNCSHFRHVARTSLALILKKQQFLWQIVLQVSVCAQEFWSYIVSKVMLWETSTMFFERGSLSPLDYSKGVMFWYIWFSYVFLDSFLAIHGWLKKKLQTCDLAIWQLFLQNFEGRVYLQWARNDPRMICTSSLQGEKKEGTSAQIKILRILILW